MDKNLRQWTVDEDGNAVRMIEYDPQLLDSPFRRRKYLPHITGPEPRYLPYIVY